MQNRTKSVGFFLGAMLLVAGGLVGNLWLLDAGEIGVFVGLVGIVLFGIVLAITGAYYGWQAVRVEEPPLFEVD